MKWWKNDQDINPSAGGVHWILCTFVNINQIDWRVEAPNTDMARIFVFDSLTSAVSEDEMTLVVQAFTQFLSKAACDLHQTSPEVARRTIAAIKWDRV